MASAVAAPEGRSAAANPLFSPSSLPYGAPAFDQIQEEHYAPAFEEGIREQLAEVEAIASAAEPATFENTLEALERSGSLLRRVSHVFFSLASAHTTPRMEELQQEFAPKLSAASDAVSMHPQLFQRVEGLYRRRAELGLSAEAMRLLETTYQDFVSAGARLDEEAKEDLKRINMELSSLQADFLTRVMLGVREGGLHVESEAMLAGLGAEEIAAASAAAEGRGMSGYLLTLQNTTQQPFLASLEHRETREALWRRSLERNEKGDAADTRERIARMARLRAEKVALLGYPSFAAWKLQDQMARTPEQAIAFLDALMPATRSGVDAERSALEKLLRAEHPDAALQPFDWAFYAKAERKSKYLLQEDDLKPYFELDRVFEEGVLFAATSLYGISFQVRTDLPVWHPDVRTYEVFEADGSHLALLYVDFFRRESKRGGAWMNSLATQSTLLGETPIICNICNFTKPASGGDALLSWDEVQTLFHEFGHALHGLFSDVRYPSLSGTSVPRDFVEFPSQFNEHWANEPSVFARYARHCQTGEPMPDDLRQRMRDAEHFNGGFALAEVLAAAELDLQWHLLGADADVIDTAEFERQALERKQIALPAVPPRYRSSYFAHLFGGGYAAGYYAYLWAEMLDADAFAAFEENGGLTRANGDRLRRMVLSRGNTGDPADLYRAWRGRDAEPGPMLRSRGIAASV